MNGISTNAAAIRTTCAGLNTRINAGGPALGMLPAVPAGVTITGAFGAGAAMTGVTFASANAAITVINTQLGRLQAKLDRICSVMPLTCPMGATG